VELHFYYDVVCPYAYFASTRVEEIARLAGARVVWHPVLLGGIYRTVGAAQDPGRVMPVSKARHNMLDMHRQAERFDVPLSLNPEHPQRSVEAMRLLIAAPMAKRGVLTHTLYRHYHVDHGRLDRASLAPIAERFGLDVSCIDDARVRQELFDATAEAVGHGAFGVPMFVVGGEMWWGADRLGQVAEALGVSWELPSLGEGARGMTLEFFSRLLQSVQLPGGASSPRAGRRGGGPAGLPTHVVGGRLQDDRHADGASGGDV
jgi:2-hydroxychromene-2-carboxylate isomerase